MLMTCDVSRTQVKAIHTFNTDRSLGAAGAGVCQIGKSVAAGGDAARGGAKLHHGYSDAGFPVGSGNGAKMRRSRAGNQVNEPAPLQRYSDSSCHIIRRRCGRSSRLNLSTLVVAGADDPQALDASAIHDVDGPPARPSVLGRRRLPDERCQGGPYAARRNWARAFSSFWAVPHFRMTQSRHVADRTRAAQSIAQRPRHPILPQASDQLRPRSR